MYGFIYLEPQEVLGALARREGFRSVSASRALVVKILMSDMIS